MGTASADPDWPLLGGLSRPALVVDAAGRLVFLNRRAEAFWGVRLADVVGQPARDILQIRPSANLPPSEWARQVLVPALDSGDSVPAETIGGDGTVHGIHVTAWGETRGGRRYAQIIVNESSFAPVPLTAQRDPISGLPLLQPGTAEHRRWDARGGTVVVFDLDALRETSSLVGAAAGDDVLNAAGRVLAAAAPPYALAARHGADEFVLLLGVTARTEANHLAAFVAERVARAVRAVGVPVPPALHHGAADFAPGGLAAGLQEALDMAHERRGTLLRSRAGGRLVLTREGRSGLQEPTDPAAAAPGSFAARFGPEFDRYCRQTYARAVDQAREFVSLVEPQPGSAVVEVGAGSGRVTFDGGLAARVGSDGQLLVTDPSQAQLQAARGRAAELGMSWIRFVCAPVEALPLEPATADLCLGAGFIHFTEPFETLRAMARVVRPGGRVALSAIGDVSPSAMWLDVLTPVREILQRHGLPLELGTPRRTLESAFHEAGLSIDRVQETEEAVDFGSASTAAVVWRQIQLIPLALRQMPRDVVGPAEAQFEERVRAAWDGASGADRLWAWRLSNIVGHRS